MLPGRPLPHQFKLHHPNGIFRVVRFLLTVVGIHRKESEPSKRNAKWILREPGSSAALAAFTLPLVAFLGLVALDTAIRRVDEAFWRDFPAYWIYLVQTIFCGGLLIWFWREYQLRAARRIIFTVAVGLLVFAIWVSPQALLGFAARLDGFNPEVFSGSPATYWTAIVLRFLRLVVVVPLVEEIFWRGFLLRYFVCEKFYAVPMGTFSWPSFAVVTIGFGFSHSRADWIAALVTGALYNCVAHRTKSLASCVLAHAITNLLLGLWIMKTRQWGFW